MALADDFFRYFGHPGEEHLKTTSHIIWEARSHIKLGDKVNFWAHPNENMPVLPHKELPYSFPKIKKGERIYFSGYWPSVDKKEYLETLEYKRLIHTYTLNRAKIAVIDNTIYLWRYLRCELRADGIITAIEKERIHYDINYLDVDFDNPIKGQYYQKEWVKTNLRNPPNTQEKI